MYQNKINIKMLTFKIINNDLSLLYVLLLHCRNTCFGLYKTNTIQQHKKTSVNTIMEVF